MQICIISAIFSSLDYLIFQYIGIRITGQIMRSKELRTPED